MKEKMFKYFSAKWSRKYIDILDKLVDQYNNKIHSSTGMSPKEASEPKNEKKVWRKLYDDYVPAKRQKPKFKFGDKVRITRKKRIFEKGYTSRWTEEVFTVSEVRYTDPITYKIVDYNKKRYREHFTSRNCKKPRKKCLELRKF